MNIVVIQLPMSLYSNETLDVYVNWIILTKIFLTIKASLYLYSSSQLMPIHSATV